jgi:hypothetical protein
VGKTLALHSELKTVQTPLVYLVIAIELTANFLEIPLHLCAEFPEFTVDLPQEM